MSSGEAKKITLKSADGELFDVPETVARECETLKVMIEDDCADNIIPVPNVSAKILAMVIEYCKKHLGDSFTSVASSAAASSSSADASASSSSDDAIKAFDKEFVKVDQSVLFDLILAANYLNVKKLLDLTCQTVADNIKEKSPEEVRELFNIHNDFTPEEEAEIRKDNAWAFE